MDTKMNAVQRIRPYTEPLTSLPCHCVTNTTWWNKNNTKTQNIMQCILFI